MKKLTKSQELLLSWHKDKYPYRKHAPKRIAKKTAEAFYKDLVGSVVK